MPLFFGTESFVNRLKMDIEDYVWRFLNRRRFTGKFHQSFHSLTPHQCEICSIRSTKVWATMTKLPVLYTFYACSEKCAGEYIRRNETRLRYLGGWRWTLSRIVKENLWKN